MFKTNKKIFLIFIALFVLLTTTCFATDTDLKDAKLEIIESNVCNINIQDKATLERKILSYDLEKREITMQLKVSNNSKPIFNEPSEIFLVIDNSLSMKNKISDTTTRLTAVTDAAKSFAKELLKNENVKIGVVSFSTGDTEGTIDDATLRTVPSNKEETVFKAISDIVEGKLGQRTNIEAGLTLANQNFSKDCKSKYLILLTDGVPNITIGNPLITYSGETTTKTKAKLEAIEKSGVTIYSVMTGVPSNTKPIGDKTYKELAEEIFGTEEKPTAGEFYYISDSEIESTICDAILSKFLDPAENTFTDLKINEYFSKNIVNNFEFSYVTKPKLGTISSAVDLKTNSITWNLGKLEPGESDTVVYKLKLSKITKDMLDVVLNVNEKVEVTANEIKTADNTNILTSKVTPKIKVSVPVKEIHVDNTVAEEVIPQTGSTGTLFILITIACVILSIAIIKFNSINKIFKNK